MSYSPASHMSKGQPSDPQKQGTRTGWFWGAEMVWGDRAHGVVAGELSWRVLFTLNI